MTVKELYEHLSMIFPRELSASWDRDGLMVCPDPARHVRRVLVTLDVTPAAVKQAVEAGVEAVISHHPLLFHPLDTLSYEDPRAGKALTLALHGISVFCFHTRADAAQGGVSDLLAEALGLADTETLGEERILRVGDLREEMTGEGFARFVKRALGTPSVVLADAGRPIRRVAVSGGEGKDLIGLARASGADASLAGRFGYHALLDAAEAGLTLLEAGHYFTEVRVLDLFARLVREATEAEVLFHREPPISVF